MTIGARLRLVVQQGAPKDARTSPKDEREEVGNACCCGAADLVVESSQSTPAEKTTILEAL